MIEGWLVYNREDLQKNLSFATLLQSHGKVHGLNLKIIERENIVMGTGEEGLFIEADGESVLPTFVINRTRDAFFARQLEYLEIVVFNNFLVTDICNDKNKTHQFINRLGIPSVKTLFFDCNYDTYEKIPLAYPLVIKGVDGHGGTEVYRANCPEEVKGCIEKIENRYVVIQEMCSQVGVDVRVFVVGNRPLAAIKRASSVDFRSNYSLGGKTSLYPIDERLQILVDQILAQLMCDCVGIDFMIDKDGQYIFNEIEDVVGSRSLYMHSDIDIASCYIQHIKEKLG